jgi:hypothetical protein
MAFVDRFSGFVVDDFFAVPISETDSFHELLYDRKPSRPSTLSNRPNEKFMKPTLLSPLVGPYRGAFSRDGLILFDADFYAVLFCLFCSPALANIELRGESCPPSSRWAICGKTWTAALAKSKRIEIACKAVKSLRNVSLRRC